MLLNNKLATKQNLMVLELVCTQFNKMVSSTARGSESSGVLHCSNGDIHSAKQYSILYAGT